MSVDRFDWFHASKHQGLLESLRQRSIDKDFKLKAMSAPKSRERALRWSRENPDKARENVGRRRSRKIHGVDTLSPDDLAIMRTIYKVSDRVSKCLGIKHHVDHIMPLSRGGRHRPSNLQAIPATLNHWKSSKTPQEFSEVLKLHGIIVE